MTSTATAVLSLDLDSTLVYKKVDEAQKRVANISKMTIVPQVDTTQITKQVQQTKAQAGVLSSFFSKIKLGIDTVQARQAVSKNLKAVEQEIKFFEQSASKVFQNLNTKIEGGSRGGYRTKQLEKNFQDLTLSTSFARASITKNFDEIFKTLEKAGAKSTAIDELKSKLQSLSTVSFAGAKNQQNPFEIGVAKAPNIRETMGNFESQIKARASIIQQFRDKVVADFAKPSTPIVIKPDVKIEPQVQVAKPDRTKFLSSLSEFATANAGPEFVKRFEWGQISKAVATEAEAAFGNEAIGRKISNQIFSFSATSAGLGYFAGKVTETLAGLAKTISVGAVRAFDVLPTAIGNSLSKSQDQASQKVGAVFQNLGEVIKRFTAIPVAAITGAFALYQIIINKSTVATAFALTSGLSKIIWMGFQKIASTTFEASKWLTGKITSIFSGGGGGGGLFSGIFSGGGGGNELSLGLTSFLGLAGLGTTINLAANLQEKMLAVSTLTGEIGAGLSKSTRDVISISNDFGKSANDVASALYDIRSASFSGQDGLLVLRSSLVASQGGLTSVSVASTAIARTLRAWNLPATEAATIADVLFNTVKRGITTFDTLAQQITQVTQVAASVGASFQDVGAAMANLTRNGQTTDQAVTGLAALFKSIIAPTDAGVTAMKELGIEWTESALRGKGFLKFLQDVAPKVLSNKRAFRELVGDVTAMKSAFVLLGDINGLSEDLNSMSERGSANFAASRIAISFNDQLRVFWENFLNIARNIGQTMLPLIQPVLEKAVEVVQVLSKFSNLDLGEVWKQVTKGLQQVAPAVIPVFETIFAYLFAKWEAIRNFVLAVFTGLANSGGKIIVVALARIMTEITVALGQLFKKIYDGIIEFSKDAIKAFSIIIENSIFGDYTNRFGKFAQKVADWGGYIFQAFTPIGLLFDKIFGSADFSETIEKGKKILNEKLDVTGTLKESANNFKKGFETVFKPELFSFQLETGTFGKLSSDLKNLADKSSDAFIDFGKQTNIALKQQSEGMTTLIKSLDDQYKSELQKGEKDKAQLTKQFLDAERDRLKNLTSQLDRSQLDVLLEKRQKLYIDLAKSQRDQNVKQTQVVIDQIKTNELIILKLEKESKLASEKAKQGIDPQINLYDTLKAKALALVKEGEKAGNSLTKLSDVLDEVFGKNIERIAEKYGVGRELVTMRNLTRDVIEAKAAGFSASDLDIIIQTGLMEKSDQLTKVFNSLGVAKKNISIDRVKELGIYDDLVILLDRASNLGLSEAGRMRLLQGKITEEAFKELDRASIRDKETNFISVAMKNFENAGEERKLQERFNDAQLRLSEITKEAVTRNQKMKQTVDILEKTVKELEIEAKKTNRNSNSVDGD